MSNKFSFYKSIEKKRLEYLTLAKNKASLVKILQETELHEHVYNSNAIENSTLTLEETEKILLKIDLDRYINEREIFEAKNLATVMEYIERNIDSRVLDLDFILFIHKVLLGNIREDIAGMYRKSGEWVKVGNHIGIDPDRVIPELGEIISEFQADKISNIIKKIARFHLKFEFIHPFIDGNGRIGRVLNNFLLYKEGYISINIAFKNRSDYYESFKEFTKNGNTSNMEEIVGKALSINYNRRLAYLKGGEIVTLREYSKLKSLSFSNLINKAKRQTINAFIENGIWKIRLDD